jgi:large subunit ribosomal protein L25
MVPAIIYGKSVEPQAVCLDAKAVRQLLGPSSGHVHRVVVADPSFEGNVMVQEVSYDPVTGQVSHIDLHNISLTDKVKTEVAIDVVGEAALEKRGLFLQRQAREVLVECMPTQIPGPLVVDVSELSPGDIVTAGDLKISEEVRLVTNPAEVLLVVMAPKSAEEETGEEGVSEGEEPEGETKPE